MSKLEELRNHLQAPKGGVKRTAFNAHHVKEE